MTEIKKESEVVVKVVEAPKRIVVNCPECENILFIGEKAPAKPVVVTCLTCHGKFSIEKK